MKRASVLVVAAALAAPAAAQAPRAPEAVRSAVIAELQSVRDQFMEEGDPRLSAPPSPDAMLSRLDVNSDGVPDWRADYARAEWPGGWCGSGGCRQQVWVSVPGGRWIAAYDDTAYRLRVMTRGGARRLEAAVHGTVCNGAGTDRCVQTYAWDRRRERLRLIATSRAGR